LTSSHRRAPLTAERVTPERRHAAASANGGMPPRASEDSPLSIEERYDEEVNELLPSDITSSDELDELFDALGSAGIEIID
jgi:hypothetical protein